MVEGCPSLGLRRQLNAPFDGSVTAGVRGAGPPLPLLKTSGCALWSGAGDGDKALPRVAQDGRAKPRRPWFGSSYGAENAADRSNPIPPRSRESTEPTSASPSGALALCASCGSHNVDSCSREPSPALLADKQIKRGVHRSMHELKAAIAAFIQADNDDPKPFIWTKSADAILQTIARSCSDTLTVHAPTYSTNSRFRTLVKRGTCPARTRKSPQLTLLSKILTTNSFQHLGKNV